MNIPVDNEWRYVNEFVEYAEEEYGEDVGEALREKANELAGKANQDDSQTWECSRCGNTRLQSDSAARVQYKDLDSVVDSIKSRSICSECWDEFIEWLNNE